MKNTSDQTTEEYEHIQLNDLNHVAELRNQLNLSGQLFSLLINGKVILLIFPTCKISVVTFQTVPYPKRTGLLGMKTRKYSHLGNWKQKNFCSENYLNDYSISFSLLTQTKNMPPILWLVDFWLALPLEPQLALRLKNKMCTNKTETELEWISLHSWTVFSADTFKSKHQDFPGLVDLTGVMKPSSAASSESIIHGVGLRPLRDFLQSYIEKSLN